MMKRAKIIGTGSYLPEKVLTNFDLEKMVDTSDEWITTRTGIKERHIAAEHQTVSDLVAEASKMAIEDARIRPETIDCIIIGTVTPDNPYPSSGNWVQKKLGIKAVPSFDLSAGCCGFLYGVILANSLIRSGAAGTVLVAGGETMSKVVNWQDRATCVLFGDGAGAAVLTGSDDETGIVSTHWNADGNLGDLLIQPAGGSAIPASKESVEKKLHTVHMKGNEVFKYAVLRMQEAAEMALQAAGLSSDAVDLFIPHQANVRIIEAAATRTNIPLTKTFINIDKTANISAGTIPIALDHARRAGRIKPGHTVLFSAFGAGFTWASAVVRF